MSSQRQRVFLRGLPALTALAWLLLLPGCLSFVTQDNPKLGYGLEPSAPTEPPVAVLEDPPLAVGQEDEDADLPHWSDGLTLFIESITQPGEDHQQARLLFTEAEQNYNAAASLRGEAVSVEQLEQSGAMFLKAANLYGEAAQNWSDSALQEDAWFMKGECLFFIDYYPKAIESYEKVLAAYSNSRYMDVIQRRRFSIANYWLTDAELVPKSMWSFNFTDESLPLRGNINKAIRVFDKIRQQDPSGDIADDATMAAALALVKKGDYERADTFLKDLRRTFPSSSHQFMANFLGVHTKLQIYLGPEYSDLVLEDAEKLVKRIRRQFPVQEKEHHEELIRMYTEIRFLLAEREWVVAQFYERRYEIGAARVYYASIINDYSDTPFAERARKRLVEVEDMPAKPAQPLPWLVALFPVEEPPRPMLQASGEGGLEP